MPNPLVNRYFGAILVAFLLSFVLMASSKWTNNIFYALMALPGLVMLVVYRGAGMFKSPLAWGWLLFIAWMVIPAVQSGDTQFYKHIVYTLLFICIVGTLIDVRQFNASGFARALFWVVCLYIYVCAAWAYASGAVPFGLRVAILPARMENVIYTSIWLTSALGLALPGLVRERRFLELAAAALLSVVAVAFVLQTRTALVGMAFLAGLWVVYGVFRAPRVALPLLLLVAVIGGAAVWAVHDQAWAHSLIGRGDSSRVALFEIMTGEWRHCGWVMGCGVDFHTSQTLPGGEAIQHPHNIFVAMGLYFGGGAFVLFCGLMLASLISAWDMRSAWGVYLACALVMLNFDGSKLIGNPDELWVLVLLPAGMILAESVRRHNRRHIFL